MLMAESHMLSLSFITSMTRNLLLDKIIVKTYVTELNVNFGNLIPIQNAAQKK